MVMIQNNRPRHTASFLQVFHTGIGTNGRNYHEDLTILENTAPAEIIEQADDLLDLVPEDAPAFTPSLSQQELITALTGELANLDRELFRQATAYTVRMYTDGLWTRGNTTRWIDNLISKVHELRAARRH